MGVEKCEKRHGTYDPSGSLTQKYELVNATKNTGTVTKTVNDKIASVISSVSTGAYIYIYNMSIIWIPGVGYSNQNTYGSSGHKFTYSTALTYGSTSNGLYLTVSEDYKTLTIYNTKATTDTFADGQNSGYFLVSYFE